MPDIFLRPKDASLSAHDAQLYPWRRSDRIVRLYPADASRGTHDVQLRPANLIVAAEEAGDPPGDITGTAEITFQVCALAIDALLIFTGTADETFAGPAFDASGLETFTGTADESFAVAGLAVTGSLDFIATASESFEVPALAGSGSLIFTGTVIEDFAVPALDGNGALVFTGTVDVAFAVPAIDASGTVDLEEFTGTVAVEFQAPAIVVTAEQLVPVIESPVTGGADGGKSRKKKRRRLRPANQFMDWGTVSPPPPRPSVGAKTLAAMTTAPVLPTIVKTAADRLVRLRQQELEEELLLLGDEFEMHILEL